MNPAAASFPADETAAPGAESEASRTFSLLTDGVDDRAPADLLEHRAVARALARAIRGTSTKEPLGIALFGAWGQGKTTIGRLLQAEFKDEGTQGKVVFVRVDAWKYAYEDTRLPLRRHFLLQAFESAGYSDEALELQEGYRLERTRRKVSPKLWPRVKSVFDRVFQWTKRRAVAVAGIVAAFGFFVGFGYLVSPFEWFIALVAGGLFLALLPIVSQGIYVTSREDPAWSIEVFEGHLQWLLDATSDSVDRFVFLIDDLDRCRDEIVVEAIATLQAFFGKERCVYVVTADEKQLKRAVRSIAQSPVDPRIDGSPVPADETFLEKIFQVSAQVPRPSVPTIRRYGRRIAESTRLSELEEVERESILAYLVHARVTSPRQARVILNEFLLMWALAEEREGERGANLRKGDLSSRKLLLAKLVVLRSHFPWFFELLYERPDLLTIWQQYETSHRADDYRPSDAVVAEVDMAAKQAASEMNGFAGGDERGRDGSVGVTSDPAVRVTLEDLEQALGAYLSLTRRTLPKDANQVQEILHLRSREEFEGLSGAAGDTYRLGIASGDEQAIVRAFAEDSSQATMAALAAASLVGEPNPVQSQAARRAAVALAALLDDADLRQVEQVVASALYSDEAVAIEELNIDDPKAHLRLAKRMPPRVLEPYVLVAPLDDVVRVATLVEAVAQAIPPAFSVLVRRALDDPEAEVLVDAVRGVRPELGAALVGPTVRGIRPTLESAIRTIDRQPVAVLSVDAEGLSVQSGEATFRVHATGLPPIEAGAQAYLSAHSNHRGELVLDGLTVGDQAILEGTAPSVAPDMERQSAWRLAEVVVTQALEAGPVGIGDGLRELAALDWQREADATRCVDLFDLVLDGSGSTAAFAEALGSSGTILRFPDAGLRSAGVLLSLDKDAATEFASRAIEIAARGVAEGASEDSCARVRDAIDSARKRLGDDAFDAALETIAIPSDDDETEALFRVVVTPASPAAASAWWVSRTRRLLDTEADEEIDWASDDDATAELLRLLGELEQVAKYAPAESRPEILKLPLTPSFPVYAERILELRSVVGALRRKIGANVLADAVRSSNRGASLARQHALQCRSLDRGALEAVLTGIVRYPLDADAFVEARALLTRRDDVIPEIEQLAFIAAAGARRKSERLYGDSDLLMALLIAAHDALATSPDHTARLLQGVSAWRGGPKRVRKEVADDFVRLLETVRSQLELEVVLTGVLGYFEEPRSVERVTAFRRALPEAVRRVGPLSGQRLLELLDEAGSRLRIENAGQSWFSDLVASRVP